MANLKDLLSGWGEDDEEAPPPDIREAESLAQPEVPPAPRVRSPLPVAPSAPVFDVDAFRAAQRDDERRHYLDSASDAMYAAFAGKSPEYTSKSPSQADALMKEWGVQEKVGKDKLAAYNQARTVSERMADRQQLEKTLKMPTGSLANLSDASIARIIGVKTSENNLAAGEARHKAQIAEELRRREEDRKNKEKDIKEHEDFVRETNAIQNAAHLREALAAAGRKQEQHANDETEKQVENAGKDLVEVAAQKADLATLEKAAEGKGDIPGVGAWDSRKPSFLQSDADIDIRQAGMRVLARYLKEVSGIAVSEPEFKRAAQQYGLGEGATEEQFRHGVRALLQASKATYAAKEAKYPPAAIDKYRQRGGKTSSDLGTKPIPSRPSATHGKVHVTNGAGETLEIDEADLADAEKDGYRRVK